MVPKYFEVTLICRYPEQSTDIDKTFSPVRIIAQEYSESRIKEVRNGELVQYTSYHVKIPLEDPNDANIPKMVLAAFMPNVVRMQPSQYESLEFKYV